MRSGCGARTRDRSYDQASAGCCSTGDMDDRSRACRHIEIPSSKFSIAINDGLSGGIATNIKPGWDRISTDENNDNSI